MRDNVDLKDFDFWLTKVQCGVQIDPGWEHILYDTLEKIQLFLKSKKLPLSHFRIDQVKEKFGQLNIYFSIPVDDEGVYLADIYDDIRNIISEGERQSKITCQECGEPGGPDKRSKTWMVTLCEKHSLESFERRKKLFGENING